MCPAWLRMAPTSMAPVMPVRATAELPRVMIGGEVWGDFWPEEVAVEDWAEAGTVWEKAKKERGSTTSRATPNFCISARVSLERGRAESRWVTAVMRRYEFVGEGHAAALIPLMRNQRAMASMARSMGRTR